MNALLLHLHLPRCAARLLARFGASLRRVARWPRPPTRARSILALDPCEQCAAALEPRLVRAEAGAAARFTFCTDVARYLPLPAELATRVPSILSPSWTGRHATKRLAGM